MKDFNQYRKNLKIELRSFYNRVEDPNRQRKLVLVEAHMDNYCVEYFDGCELNSDEYKNYQEINQSVYDEFVLEIEPGLRN